MLHKKRKKAQASASFADFKREMAEPRMARSARIMELNQDSMRIPEQPSTTLLGTVFKIIPPESPTKAEKAEIAIDGADRRYRMLRIDNILTDEHGDDASLKKGVHVNVTVTIKSHS
jgi:hypothetical protein